MPLKGFIYLFIYLFLKLANKYYSYDKKLIQAS